MSELLDIDELLAPIPGDNPCGESLKYQPLWDEIVAARRGRVDAVAEGEDLDPEWSRVVELSCDALQTHSKDLQIVGWLTEALVRTKGFAGLDAGLHVLIGLVENFWEGLYPELDEEDPEVRGAPLYWLTDEHAGARLPGLLREVPITVPDSEGVTHSVAGKQLNQPRPQREGEDSSEYAARNQEMKQRVEMFESAVTATPNATYLALRDDLAKCAETVRDAERIIDQNLGVEHSPSWSAIRQALEDCSGAVEQICRTRGLLDIGEDGEVVEAGAAGGDPSANGSGPVGTGPIRTRAEAVARLREVVDFFKRSEPHSPVALLIDRAVRWANSPFERVLAELVQDDSTLSRIRDMLGLPEEEEES